MNESDQVIINNRIAAERRDRAERLRDEFAMAALTGLLAADPSYSFVQALKESYGYADEALKAREQSK